MFHNIFQNVRNLGIIFEPRNMDEHAEHARITKKGISRV